MLFRVNSLESNESIDDGMISSAPPTLQTTSSADGPRPLMWACRQVLPRSNSASELMQRAILVEGSVVDDYELTDCVGSGSFATVFRGIDRRGDKGIVVAIKRVKKLRMAWQMFRKQKVDVMSEVKVMSQLQHPNIIRLIKVYDNQVELALVLEYAEGGPLLKKLRELGRYPEVDGRTCVRSILSALHHMHKLDIVHRDVKLDNIVLMSKTDLADVKLVDFGVSKLTKEDSMKSFVGTPDYLAPEMLTGGELEYGKEIDAWAVGVMTYQLLCGTLPFQSKNNAELYDKILNQKLDFPEEKWAGVSANAKDFVSRLLVANPKERMSIDEALRHSWVSFARNSHMHSFYRNSRAPSSLINRMDTSNSLFRVGTFETLPRSDAISIKLPPKRQPFRRPSPPRESSRSDSSNGMDDLPELLPFGTSTHNSIPNAPPIQKGLGITPASIRREVSIEKFRLKPKFSFRSDDGDSDDEGSRGGTICSDDGDAEVILDGIGFIDPQQNYQDLLAKLRSDRRLS